MKDFGIVRGSKAQAMPIVVNIDTVYIHSDIRKVDDESEIYEYQETQYTLREYTELLANLVNLEGSTVAKLKLADMQKNALIQNLGKALTQARLDIMALKAKVETTQEV